MYINNKALNKNVYNDMTQTIYNGIYVFMCALYRELV